MTGTLEFRVIGLDDLDKRLARLQGRELQKRVYGAMAEAARAIVVPAVKAAAPVGRGRTGRYAHPPGYLRSKVSARKLKLRAGEAAAIGVRARAWYGHFVTGGTRYSRANPFVVRAAAPLSGAVRQRVASALMDLTT